MSMDAHASLPQGYKDQPSFRNPFPPQQVFQPMNSNGIFLGSTISQNLSYTPMYQGFFPNHPGSQVGYQNPPSFMFRERKGKVNWRNISSLDVDEMVGKGDIRMLESYLSNICFANIDQEDVERIGDVNLLKLFRLSQYSLEYLLNCQNYLANQTQSLEYQYRLSDEQLLPLEEQAKRNHAEILKLKNEIGEKKGMLDSYQNVLSTPMYKCHLCTKIFKSQEYLNTHFQTRHENALQPKKPKAETAVQTQNNTQQENAVLVEKLMAQLKENEDHKLTQLTSTLQSRLQEVIQSNKELTAKVAEMEKKLDQEREAVDIASPDQPFSRTLRQNPHLGGGYSLNDLQSKVTPKRGQDRRGAPDSPSKQVFRAGDLEEAEDVRTERVNQRYPKQSFKAGSLKDLEDDKQQKSQLKMDERHERQAFNAGSLRDIEEEEEGEIRQNNISNKRNSAQQAFNAGSLKELEDIEEVEERRHSTKSNKSEVKKIVHNERQSFKAGSLHDVDDEEQSKTRSVPSVKSVKSVKKLEDGREIKRQAFYAGDLEPDFALKKAKDVQDWNAGELEDDKESVEGKNRKRSQEEIVIVEEQEEEGFEMRKGSYEKAVNRNTEEKNEDEIREAHRNAVIKASNLIKNKYRHPITKEDYEKAEQEVSKDLKRKSKDILKTEYHQLGEQNTENLMNMQNKLKNLNKKDMKQFDKFEQEFIDLTSEPEPAQKSNGKERYAQDGTNKNKLTQSSELMNLVVDPERKGKDLKTSVEAHKNMQNVRESGTNLMKKSIQGGEAEYL